MMLGFVYFLSIISKAKYALELHNKWKIEVTEEAPKTAILGSFGDMFLKNWNGVSVRNDVKI
jgi:hypothetical protein